MSVTSHIRAFDKSDDREDLWSDTAQNQHEGPGEPDAAFGTGLGPRTGARLLSGFLAADAVDSLVVKIMALDLISTVILQRIYLGTSITLLTHFLSLGLLAYGKRLELSPARVAAFLAFFGAAFASSFFSGNGASATAIALAVACYVGFMFVVPANQATYMEVVKVYQRIALVVSALVFLQLATQLLGLGMPNEDAVVPSALVAPSMNYIQNMEWRASLIKPNAIFMLEASYTCQFIGIAWVIEIAFFRRMTWLATLTLGMLGTASGTGIMLVLLCLPLLLRRFLRQLLLGGIVVVAVGVPLAITTGWYDLASKRAATFTTHGSSANSRFVGPYENVLDVLEAGNAHDILSGYGAGAVSNPESNPNLDYLEYSPITKVFLEYGLPTTLVFLLYVTYLFFGGGAPVIVAWAVTLEYHLMGGHFVLPPILNYAFILCAGWKLPRLSHVRRADLRKREVGAEILAVASQPQVL